MTETWPPKLLSGLSFFSLQLPIKVGHQNTHTKVSTEHNKECLINISKYKFSLVISGLTTILKNVNNMVSAASVRGGSLGAETQRASGPSPLTQDLMAEPAGPAVGLGQIFGVLRAAGLCVRVQTRVCSALGKHVCVCVCSFVPAGRR